MDAQNPENKNATADSAPSLDPVVIAGDGPLDFDALISLLSGRNPRGPRRSAPPSRPRTADEHLARVRTALLGEDYTAKVHAVGLAVAQCEGAPAGLTAEFAIGLLRFASREHDTRVLLMLTDAARALFQLCTDQVQGIVTRIAIDAVHQIHHVTHEQG